MPRLVLSVGDGYSFPLGIAYVSASMKRAGHRVATLNLNHRHGDVQEIIAQEIRDHQIDVVATGGLSFQYSTIRSVLDAAKQANPKVITVVGGGIITSDPETAMTALESADFGVVGEGEITMVELCRALEAGSDPADVAGLIFRAADGGWQTTMPRGDITALDSLPWPDYEGFELRKLLDSSPSISGLNRKNTVFMIASRSCPYNCTFCFHTVGRGYRQRSLDSFFAELDQMVAQYDIGYICLADELFSHDLQRVKDFCRKIKPYNIRWWAQFRVDGVTPELIEVVKDGGCDVMSFGLESADNRILRSMRKHTTVEQIEAALKLVCEAGISMAGAFIFGDIEETWETANNTLEWWRRHREYKIDLNLISVYPGSYLYEYACTHGIIRDRVAFLRQGCPQVNVSKLSDSQFGILIREIMETPMTLAGVLSTVEVSAINYRTGRLEVAGTCTACGHPNRWKDVKLFAANFLGCQRCGQRYNTVLPPELRQNVDTNLERMLALYGRVAVWGINYHTADLFRNSAVFRGEGVFPVDISTTKRMMDLYGRQVAPPEVIDSEEIPAVIIAIPVYFNQIEAQIRKNHPQVRQIIDICRLIDPEFVCNSAPGQETGGREAVDHQTSVKPTENAKREQLRREKPLVYEKVRRYEGKIRRGESIAIIQFQYDYACNFACEHCSIKGFQGRRKARTFTLGDVRELSRQADELGLAHFVVTGGEPLVFPDLDQLIAAIDPAKFYITSDTNGWLLDDARARHLKSIGLDKIQLSLDSLVAEEHDAFRRKEGAHERAVRAIDAALNAGLNIILSTVVTKQRVRSREFIDFLEFAKSKNVGTFVTYAKPVGAWEGNYDALVDRSDMDYMRELEKRYNLFTHLTPAYGLDLGCIAVKRMISITKYGDVMPCPYIHVSLGNVFEEPLKDIIARGMNIKYFGRHANTCWIAENRPFIEKYIAGRVYGKPLPVPVDEVFTSEDLIDPDSGSRPPPSKSCGACCHCDK